MNNDQKSPTCIWHENQDGQHETECGNTFEFSWDGVEKNGFKICPYCGRGIVVKGSRFDRIDVCDDEEAAPYSDVAHFRNGLQWAYAASAKMGAREMKKTKTETCEWWTEYDFTYETE